MEEKKPSKIRRVLTNIFLVIMLMVLPLGSWYYLNSGANVYRSIMNELGEYGNVPDFQLNDIDGNNIANESFEKNLLVVNFSPLEKENPQFEGMKFVYDQFADNKKVLFLSINSKEVDSTYSKVISKMEIDANQWYFLYGDKEEVLKLKNEEFSMPDSISTIVKGMDNALILVDTNSVVRNFYSSTDTMQLNKLITTMSLLMPRPEKAEIKFEREKEK